MKQERRWLKSAIIASLEAPVCMPWTRSARSKPEALKPAPKSRAMAAR